MATSSALQILIMRSASFSLMGSNFPLRLAMARLMIVAVLKNEAIEKHKDETCEIGGFGTSYQNQK